MEAILRRPQPRTGHPARQVPPAAGPGRGRHCRRPVVQNSAPQLQRTVRRRHQLPPRRRLPPLPRLPDGRQHRRVEVQRRRTRRHGARPLENREDRQQNARRPRNPLRQDRGQRVRLHREGQRERQNQDTQGRRPDIGQRRDTGAPDAGHVVGQDHRRPLRLHRLRGEHLAQLLRHRRAQAPLPHRERRPAQVRRQHPRPAAPRTGNPPRRGARKPALRLARKDIHRRTHL